LSPLRGITEASVGVELAVDIAAGMAVTVTVTVFGGIADVRSNDKETLLVKIFSDDAASVDECEPISRCLQVKSSSRELVLNLTISNDKNHIYLRLGSSRRNLARPDVTNLASTAKVTTRAKLLARKS
jgi:hypothetical protein